MNRVHDLPLGLMPESMARQFGSFLGLFLDYDAKMMCLGGKQLMRLKFILDKFYLVRVRVKVSKIVFCWNLSPRAPTRRGMVAANYWLRESDGTSIDKLGQYHKCYGPHDTWPMELGSDAKDSPIPIVD
ncbi:hypothetical protein Golob_007489, partial [Gossypium lobatum]|nr:hypothetical protein [Gossypium lobatum]